MARIRRVNEKDDAYLSRLRELRSMEYKDYLLTSEWQAKRQEALVFAGNACQLCNSTEKLNVHHRTYERRGNEMLSDLFVMCGKCHERFHINTEDGRASAPIVIVTDEEEVYEIIRNYHTSVLLSEDSSYNAYLCRDVVCQRSKYRDEDIQKYDDITMLYLMHPDTWCGYLDRPEYCACVVVTTLRFCQIFNIPWTPYTYWLDIMCILNDNEQFIERVVGYPLYEADWLERRNDADSSD